MTQHEIIEMAKRAGFDPHDMSSDFTCNLEDINAFTKLVAAKEREACAKLCDGLVNDENTIEYANGAYRCSALIRSRGQA